MIKYIECKRRSGQISIEIIAIIGFGVAVLIPSLLILHTYLNISSERLALLQAGETAKNIVNIVDMVSSTGAPSKITTTVYIPRNEEIRIRGKELIFTLRTSSGLTDIVEMSDVNMSGNLSINKPGLYQITISAEECAEKCVNIIT